MFDYLLNKISSADIADSPFEHIEIDNFFSEEHFFKVINSQKINTGHYQSDELMFDALYETGYKLIEFPGCFSNDKEYIHWHKHKYESNKINNTCETFGAALRLEENDDPFIENLIDFFRSTQFLESICNKFNINLEETYFDGGIQKYLDGYEISPHPDIRRKALTFMININPGKESENISHHTNYHIFKKEYSYLYSFWENNHEIERCWVPWEWCDTIKSQNKNNSIVLFSPNNKSLHSIKAAYDHLLNQRTQIYGNLWYKKIPNLQKLEWDELDLLSKRNHIKKPLLASIYNKITNKIRSKRFDLISNKANKSSIKNKSGSYS